MDRPRPRRRRSRLAAIPAALAVAAPLAGCQGDLLDPKGPIAAAEANILIVSACIMLAIIVPTMLATVAFAWWYRASNPKARYRPDWAFSGRVELVVWSVPLLTIIFLGGIAWIGSHELDPAVPIRSDRKTIEIQVVSLDWKWLFIYPEHHIAAVNQLVIPTGTPIHFSMTSSSVWNSFFVPRLGSQIYTMRGMATQLYLQADHDGAYRGLSTHFSGDGFSDMSFTVTAKPEPAFDAWVGQARASGPPLDRAAYTELAKQSFAAKPSTYSAVDHDLFQGIVSQAVAPGPGPSGGAAPDVTPKGGT